MTRVGSTVAPAASTSGRCCSRLVCLSDLPAPRRTAVPAPHRVSREVKLGRRTGADRPPVLQLDRDGSARPMLPHAAIGVNAAGVLEAEVVSADAFEDDRSKAAAAQAALAALRGATQDLQAHFNLGDDGALQSSGEWDGFTEEDVQLLRQGRVLREQEQAASKATKPTSSSRRSQSSASPVSSSRAAAAAAPAGLSLPAGSVSEDTVATSGVRSTRARGSVRRGRSASWGKQHVKSTAPVTSRASAAPMDGSGDGMKMFLRRAGQHQLLTGEEEKELAVSIQSLIKLEATFEQLKVSLQRDPTLMEWAVEAGMETEAFRRQLATGRSARDRMINSNLRLVVSIAKRFINRGMPLEDLVAEGIIGLMKGVERFDPGRGFKFSTYAHWWIRQAVSRSISDQARVIRLPVHLHELMSKAKKAERSLMDELHREPSRAEVASRAGISEARLHTLSRTYRLPTSMDAPLRQAHSSSEARTLEDYVEDETADTPDDTALHQLLKQDLDNALLTLNERECGVLRLRYGLDDGEERTLEEIGQHFKVTRERIRQIESKALRKLRQPQRQTVLADYSEGTQAMKAAGRKGRLKA